MQVTRILFSVTVLHVPQFRSLIISFTKKQLETRRDGIWYLSISHAFNFKPLYIIKSKAILNEKILLISPSFTFHYQKISVSWPFYTWFQPTCDGVCKILFIDNNDPRRTSSDCTNTFTDFYYGRENKGDLLITFPTQVMNKWSLIVSHFIFVLLCLFFPLRKNLRF